METYSGKKIFSGVAIGRIFHYAKVESIISRKKITDVAAEIQRYEQAKEKAITQLKALYEKAVKEVGELNAQIFEVHSMMLGDDDSGKTEVYPNLTYNLSNKFGSVTTGVRMTFDKYGVAKFAIPINWKCTLADIKK